MEDIGHPAIEVLPEADIMRNLTNLSDITGIGLTFSNKLFFLRLIDLLKEDASFQVAMSVDELASSVNMPVRTVIQCLNRLTACGAIYDEPKTRPRTTRLNQTVFIK